MSVISTDVVVLGGGLCGLAAAYDLTEKGKKVVLIEKEKEVGGMCKTIERGGFLFDLGGHRFLTSDDKILQLVKNLLGQNLTIRPRKSAVYWQGKYFMYPLQFLDLSTKLVLTKKIKIFFSFFYQSINNLFIKPHFTNLKQYLISKFGNYLYENFFKEYNEKLWGLSPEAISSDWAEERIPNLDTKQILSNIIFRKQACSKSWYDYFYYPQKGGIGAIAKNLEEAIKKKDALLFLNTELLTVYCKKGKIVRIDCVKDEEKHTILPKYVISTIPLNIFIRKFRIPLNIDFSKIDRGLKYRSIRLLNLIINKERVTDYTWIYVPNKDIIFFRIQEPKNWHPNNAPMSKTSLSLEISCDKGDEIWIAKEQEILQKVLEGLKKMELNVKEEDIIDYFISEIEHAYPIYILDYKKILSEVEDVLTNIRNLTITGRQGEFKYMNMDEAIKKGIDSSHNAVEYLVRDVSGN
jgi:protoporphyrinogen oxidase